MSNLFIHTLSSAIARQNIHILNVVYLTRWISLTYKLSGKIIDSKNEVLIRLATEEDFDFLAGIEENNSDSGYHIVRQNIRFWNDYGLRCLYVGHLKDDPRPCCYQYAIFPSDIHHLRKTPYGAMYAPLTKGAVHLEGAYVLNKLRQKDFFTKFSQSRDIFLYQKGIRMLRTHVHCDKTKFPILKWCAKKGYIPDHWISRVIIRFPFFKTDEFVHSPVRDRDHSKFPLSLFYQVSTP